MSDLDKYAFWLKHYSGDWWDDLNTFYPAYFSACAMEKMPEHAKADWAQAGLWPPPREGVTVLRSGVVIGDARESRIGIPP